MTRNIYVTNASTSPSVTIDNALVNGIPSTLSSLVTVTANSGSNLSTNGVSGFFDVYLNSSLENYLEVNNMIWGQDGGNNALNNVTSGNSDDTIMLNRSAARGINTYGGDDVMHIDKGFVYRADMGAGNDSVVLIGNRSQLSQEEIDAKAAAVGTNEGHMMAINGGSGDDHLAITGGPWTMSINVNATIMLNGATLTTRTFTNENFSLVTLPGTSFNGTIQYPDYQDSNGNWYPSKVFVNNFESMSIYCFVAGTLVDTPAGRVPIEALREGDLVRTRHGDKALKWIGRRKLDVIDLAGNPKLAPVRIPKGAFGRGLPFEDVFLSPQHRIVIRSLFADQMFASNEVMVPIKQLVGLNDISIDHDLDEVHYYHLMFDEHTTIMVEGIEAETLYPGVQALKAVTEDARRELISIFPELAHVVEGETEELPFTPAMPLLKGRDARILARRIIGNGHPLYGSQT